MAFFKQEPGWEADVLKAELDEKIRLLRLQSGGTIVDVAQLEQKYNAIIQQYRTKLIAKARAQKAKQTNDKLIKLMTSPSINMPQRR